MTVEERFNILEKNLIKLSAHCFEMKRKLNAINKKFSVRDDELVEQLEIIDKKYFHAMKNVVEYVKKIKFCDKNKKRRPPTAHFDFNF